MKPLSIDEVCSLFDRVDENILSVFYFDPNSAIREGQQIDYTLTIKDRFKVKFHRATCRYKDLDICWIKFRSILHDNMLTIYQLKDLQEKLKRIADPNFYDTVSITDANSTGMSRLDAGKNRSTKLTSGNRNEKGIIGGSSQRGAHRLVWDKRTHEDMLQTLTDKNEMAYMQVLTPDIDDVTQSLELNKNYDFRDSTEISNDISRQTSGSVTQYKNVKRVEAANDIAALTAAIPKIIEQYLEKFNIMFYV